MISKIFVLILIMISIIKSVTRITRSESESPTMLKNADFSTKTIKKLIEQSERKTLEKLVSNEPLKFDFIL